MALETPTSPPPKRPKRPAAESPRPGGWARRIVWALILAAVCAYFASGFYFVQPDERAVVRRFGKVVEKQAPPGLHYAWPPPIGRVDRPKTTEVKRVTVGLDPRARAAIAAGDIIAQGQSGLTDVFTGDSNIVKATMVATYQITQADRYVTTTDDPDGLVALMVQSAMIETLGGYSIDAALTGGKAKIQETAREQVQKLLDRFECGITLVEVNLESIEPPFAINDAFRDVASAKKDLEKTIDQAESFAASMVSRAGGRAYELTAAARGYYEQRTHEAKADAKRFTDLHAEYIKAPRVTKTRLLLNTLTRVLSTAKTYVVTPNQSGPPLRLTIEETRQK